MGKQQQTRGRARPSSKGKQDQIGKGKVTPVQVAFIVDRYLSDNNFSEARSVFRTEASSLISTSPIREAPKSLLSLGAMLDEYISLKEQKVMLDQEKARVEQERLRIHNLLLGMQGVMNVYRCGGSDGGGGGGGGGTVQTSSPFTPHSAVAAVISSIPIASRPVSPRVGSPASGCPVDNTPAGPMPSTSTMEVSNFTAPVTSQPSTKNRKRIKASIPNLGAKKSRNQSTATQLPNQGIDWGHPRLDLAGNALQNNGDFSVVQSSARNDSSSKYLVQASGVAKALFAQPLTPAASSVPTTPPQLASTSQSEKFVSPSETCSTAKSNVNSGRSQYIATCDPSKISSELTLVSPSRQVAEIFPGEYQSVFSPTTARTDMQKLRKRDHVKGRLDFGVSDVPMTSEQLITDESSPSESGEMGLYDDDLPNLDDFGPDLFVSELLADFNIECEAIGFACKPASGSSANSVPKPADESRDGVAAPNKVLYEQSPTLTDILSEKDMNLQGQTVLTSPKSTTKGIKIQSPATALKSCVSDQENLCTANRLIQ